MSSNSLRGTAGYFP
jgi:hypothetical protein